MVPPATTGAVRVRSKPGAGTSFELYLPVHSMESQAVRLDSQEIPRGNGQRILMVDDEIMVVKPMQMMLERIGYKVVIFTNPEEALTQFAAGPDQYDAMISDYQMPYMSGVDLAKKIMMIRPDLPVFIASGFTGHHSEDSIRATGVRGIITKPTELAELAGIMFRTFQGVG